MSTLRTLASSSWTRSGSSGGHLIALIPTTRFIKSKDNKTKRQLLRLGERKQGCHLNLFTARNWIQIPRLVDPTFCSLEQSLVTSGSRSSRLRKTHGGTAC